MSEDASLDRFAASESDEDDEDADADGATEELDGTDPDSVTGSADADDAATESGERGGAGPSGETGVAPAVSTFAWSSEGGECAACGDVVERRWRADGERGGELVCPDCKEW